MFLRNFWLGISWGIIIIVLSAVPGNYFPKIQSFADWLSVDKLVHIFLYFIFTYLIIIGVFKQKHSYKHKHLIFGIMFAVFFGGLLEIMQRYLFVGRDGNLYDFLANLLGCVLSYVLILYVERKNLLKSS